MRKNKGSKNDMARMVQRWFRQSVTYEGEVYTIDQEQAEAVADESLNAIVVARAGSGKTRTIVAKIVYLIAKKGLDPDEIMAFVFNANAATEINKRLSRMMVDGRPVIEQVENDGESQDAGVMIARTFHAFSRKIVYEVCGGKEECGKILAGDKEQFVETVVRIMMHNDSWRQKITDFVKGGVALDDARLMDDAIMGDDEATDDGEMMEDERRLTSEDIARFANMMSQFINRAQQRYLGKEVTLGEDMARYLDQNDIGARERLFIELGVECYKRYHWYLLSKNKYGGLGSFKEFGTDFNLIVSWASKLIMAKRGETQKILAHKKYILIDEYQDFSQLFLAAVEAIRSVANNARLFVVGDDWQAINRFAGSDVEYFKEFERYFPSDPRRLTISTNYRCDYRVVDTARRFMAKAMNEKGDFRAFSRRAGKVMVVDPREVDLEYAFVEYDKRVSGKDDIYIEMARRMIGRTPKVKTVKYVKALIEIVRKNRRAEEIMLLHRNNVTNIEGISLAKMSVGLRWGLAKMGIMEPEEYDTRVKIMTMHRSKGLEAEVVIILETDAGIIPKIHPDTMLYAMFGETEEVSLNDQVRLFYVAMTRAKRRLYIIHEKTKTRKGSGFIKYLGWGLDDY